MAGPSFEMSDMQKQRQGFVPTLPKGLQHVNSNFKFQELPVQDSIREKYPSISRINYVEFTPSEEQPKDVSPLRIGVVLSGGQAPGGHNVIMGVFDYIKRHHPSSQLFGFLNGPKGVFTNNFVEIDEELMNSYRNQGGFDMICSGRDKIETEEQYANSLKYCEALNLNGLVVIGGDDSNTNAALLADYFIQKGSNIKVIGCPKTIDGDLKNEFIEISFGFDTATKVYQEVVGNVCLDALCSKKYYHFVRLMGRSASHIALECELNTRANLVLVGEEVEKKNMTLEQIVDDMAQMITRRAELGKAYGVVLVPEGLIEFIPEVKVLITELNEILAGKQVGEDQAEAYVNEKLTESSKHLFNLLPGAIRKQLLLDRDPHGNVQVAKIETERLLMLLLDSELQKRNYPFPFLPQSHYFGYEGRCALPSNFDASYCYALGATGAALVKYGFTGCMAVCRGLQKEPSEWEPAGCPLAAMMVVERRKGKDVAVIEKALVELESPMFKAYEQMREHWKYNDCYKSPGPIQFEGPGSGSVPFMVKPPTAEDLASSADDASSKFPYHPHSPDNMSVLAKALMEAPVEVPKVLERGLEGCSLHPGDILQAETEEARESVHEQFPELNEPTRKKFIELVEGSGIKTQPLKVGVVILGRQASGVHNVIDGLLFALESKPGSEIYGFVGGNEGLFNNQSFKITKENFAPYRNQGGIEFLGRSGDFIRGSEQQEKTKATCENLSLDGLVIVGASHSLTDAAALSEYFLKNSVKTKVIGVPATIDANISHSLFETTIGFDTASRVNAQLIGNMMTDAASATKYFYFIRLMGREPSHLVLEAALQTHPNGVLISEYYQREGLSLSHVVSDAADIVSDRAAKGKMFGTFLVPEGLLMHLAHHRELIIEVNSILANKTKQERNQIATAILEDESQIENYFSHYSVPVLKSLPKWFQKQVLTRIDSNGYVQLSLLETERLLADLVADEMKRRKNEGTFTGAFSPVCHFFGYQARCSYPSNLDCSLGTTYGAIAVALIAGGVTGYMPTARGLTGQASKWRVGAIPLTAIMRVKGRSQYGRNKAVVPSSEVDLRSPAFTKTRTEARNWEFGDRFTNPGPIQYFSAAKYLLNLTLQYDHKDYLELLQRVNLICDRIQQICRFGVNQELLRTAAIGLSSVEGILNLHKSQ